MDPNTGLGKVNDLIMAWPTMKHDHSLDETGVTSQRLIVNSYNSRAEFPVSGSADHVYVEQPAGDVYIWNGTDYVIFTPATEGSTSKGEISDGYHTFNELYHHRAVLFSVLCNQFPELCWKSKLHHDMTMYDDMFIVGFNSPYGQATYHYDIEPYWDYFNVKELDKAPEWDGHTPSDAIERIRKFSLALWKIDQKTQKEKVIQVG